MRDDVGLMRAILEDPDDDLPRHAYSDWCDDQGDAARADFIRAQLALARKDDPALRSQAAYLLAVHGKRWEKALPPVPRPVRYERGFVEHVEAKVMADWLMSADAWFVSAPVRSLDVRLPSLMAADAVRRFKRNPSLRRLRSLSVGFPSSADPALALPLLGSANLAGLRRLALHRDGRFRDTHEFGVALGGAGCRLEGLELPGCVLGHGIEAFLDSARLDRLAHLDLSGNGLEAGDAARLAACPGLDHLRWLDLDDAPDAGRSNDLEAEGLTALVGGPGLDSLSALLLGNNGIRDAGIDAMLAWPRLANLRRLSLARNPLTERSVIALAGCRDLAGLRSLDLHGIEGIGAGAVQALAQSPYLRPALELRMGLADSPVADEWAETLARRFPAFQEA